MSGTQCASSVDVAPSMGALNPTAVACFQQSSMKGSGTIAYDESGIAKPVKTQPDGQMVAYTTKLHNTQSNNAGKIFEERSTCLDANSPPPEVFYPVRYGYHQQDTLHHEAGIMSTLPSGSNNNVGHYTATVQAMKVRRLTPTECERLQGFPDGYTLVPNRGKPAADGPRYKALGNSWAVPCARWIGKRIQAEVERTA